MKLFVTFRNRLSVWLEAQPDGEERDKKFRRYMGSVFVKSTTPGVDRETLLKDCLQSIMGEGLREDFASQMANLSKGNKGSQDLAVALFLVCKFFEPWSVYYDDAHRILFGRKSIKSALKWEPVWPKRPVDLETGVNDRSLRSSGSSGSKRIKPAFFTPDLAGWHQYNRPEFAEVKAALLSENDTSVAITTALQGAGGYGKTALAEELCLDSEVRATFPGGIYWLQFGEDGFPTMSTIADALQKLGVPDEDIGWFLTDSEAVNCLFETLPEERHLLILDDIWREPQFLPFEKTPTQTSLVITTRNKSVAAAAFRQVDVDRLGEEQSFKLLTFRIKDVPKTHTPRLKRLINGFGNWALLLQLANGAFRVRQAQGTAVATTLEYFENFQSDNDLTALDTIHPSEGSIDRRRRSVAFCIEVGLTQFSNVEQEALHELAIFPEEANVPFDVILDFWLESSKFSRVRGQALLDRFANLSLFRNYDVKHRKITLHDEIRTYLRLKMSE